MTRFFPVFMNDCSMFQVSCTIVVRGLWGMVCCCCIGKREKGMKGS